MDSDDLVPVVEAFLDEFYGDVDWRKALDGDRLALDATIARTDCKTLAVTFVEDDMRQVAGPAPFDAFRCAGAIDRVSRINERKQNS